MPHWQIILSDDRTGVQSYGGVGTQGDIRIRREIFGLRSRSSAIVPVRSEVSEDLSAAGMELNPPHFC